MKTAMRSSSAGRSRHAPEILAALMTALPANPLLALCCIDLKAELDGLRDLVRRAPDHARDRA